MIKRLNAALSLSDEPEAFDDDLVCDDIADQVEELLNVLNLQRPLSRIRQQRDEQENMVAELRDELIKARKLANDAEGGAIQREKLRMQLQREAEAVKHQGHMTIIILQLEELFCMADSEARPVGSSSGVDHAKPPNGETVGTQNAFAKSVFNTIDHV